MRLTDEQVKFQYLKWNNRENFMSTTIDDLFDTIKVQQQENETMRAALKPLRKLAVLVGNEKRKRGEVEGAMVAFEYAEKATKALDKIAEVMGEPRKIVLQSCFDEFGYDLDGCSRQGSQGCVGCSCLVEVVGE
jgi:hypothetical protein